MRLKHNSPLRTSFPPVRYPEDHFSELRHKIFRAIKAMPEFGIRMPSQWLRVRERVIQLIDRKTIRYQEYLELCKNENLSTGSAQTLIRYLHNTGIVFYQTDLFENKNNH